MILDDVARDNFTDILWTNLFRCDIDGGSVIRGCTDGELSDILAFQRGLLTLEIQLLRPTAVLLFTGPDYDVAVRDEFSDVAMQPAMEREERQFAWMRHPALPRVTVRTYHPGYLMRTQRWAWLHDIARCVTE